MEGIIAKLLSGNTEEITSATAELNAIFNNPETTAQLCQVLTTSPEVPIRQYAGVLLKKRIKKLSLWHSVPAEQQESIKGSILQVLANEPNKSVRSLIAQIVGLILNYEHEIPNWMPNVLQFVHTYIASTNVEHVELGSHALAVLTETSPDQFQAQITQICEMFHNAVTTHESNGNLASPIVCNFIDALTNMVPIVLQCTNADQNAFEQAIPVVVKVLRALVILPEPERYTQAFEFLEALADFSPKLLNNNVKLLVEFCLEVGVNQSLAPESRSKSISFVAWLVRIKKKTVLKLKLLECIATSIFNVMCKEPEDPEHEGDYFYGNHSAGAMCAATQALDLIALNMPSEKFLPIMIGLINNAVQSDDPQVRCGGYLAMAVVAEGCTEIICNKFIASFLQLLKNGIMDGASAPRNAAFFALGQFAEHLQPEISKYAPEVLPILFQYLENLCNELSSGAEEPKHVSRMFYALENLCENLGEDLVPFLPILMQRLAVTLNPLNSVSLRELALSATSAAATATKQHLLPYFEHLIQILRTYLMPTEDESTLKLRPAALDTLAAMARNIGKEHFLPMSEETMAYALHLLNGADDPTLRRALYNLIASLAEIMNEDMSKVFPLVMVPIKKSILTKMTDDSSDEEAGEDGAEIEIDIGEDSSSDEDIHPAVHDDDDGSHLDEKQEAILAVKHFAEYTGAAFVPYLEEIYEMLYALLDDREEDFRKSSLEALASVVPAMHKHLDKEKVKEILHILFPKIIHLILLEEDTEEVLAAIETVAEILKSIQGSILLAKDLRDNLFSTISELLQGTVSCLCQDDKFEEEDSDDSELENSVIESGGNLLPIFGRCLTPQEFHDYFTKILPFLLKKLRKIKNNEDHAMQRAFVYGVLAESFKGLAEYSGFVFQELQPVLIQGIQDKHPMARQNAVFALGELVFHAGETAYPSYGNILQTLSVALTNEQTPATLDNICGAVARLIIRNHSIVPLAQVLPTFFASLPLREDFDENETMFECFKTIIQIGEPAAQHGDAVVINVINVLYKKQCDEKTFKEGVLLLQNLRAQNPQHFEELVAPLTDVLEFLKTIL